MPVSRLMTGLREAGRDLWLRALIRAQSSDRLRIVFRTVSGHSYCVAASWNDLEQELACWQAAGKTAEFWWRDDDAVRPTPQLEKLLALRRTHGVPVGLSVIPAAAQADLAARLSSEDGISILQHGWAHTDHSRHALSPSAEFGSERSREAILGDLARGRTVLDQIFGDAWLKVVVPPFNYIEPNAAAALPAAGYVGLSTHGFKRYRIPGLAHFNVHIDPMDWSKGVFVGEELSLGRAVAHLQAKREGLAASDEPTGVGTHHLNHDDRSWRFLEALFTRLRTSKAVSFCKPEEMFCRGGQEDGGLRPPEAAPITAAGSGASGWREGQ